MATIDAEAAVVGAAMHVPLTDVERLLDRLSADDFADPHLHTIWSAITDAATNGVRPDPVTVYARVKETVPPEANRLSVLGQKIIAAYADVPHPASAMHYAQQVIDTSYRRAAQTLGQRIAQAAETSAVPDLDTLVRDEVDRLRTIRSRIPKETSVA